MPKGAHLASAAGQAEVAAALAANAYFALCVAAGRAPFIDAFASDPALLAAVAALKPAWAQPFRFRRQLLRSNIPGAQRSATKVHYDQM